MVRSVLAASATADAVLRLHRLRSANVQYKVRLDVINLDRPAPAPAARGDKTLALEIVDAGFGNLSKMAHPDTGGTVEAQAALENARAWARDRLNGSGSLFDLVS